jgi:CheY-like chemotaxis protein
MVQPLRLRYQLLIRRKGRDQEPMSDRILIVDDEEHIRRMIRYTLEAAGYQVGEAQDGYHALELYGDGMQWNAVILDQRMPGIDGLETLRCLKQKNQRAMVVMATAYASIELAVDAMKLGATDFVRKPLSPETLRNAVATALSKRDSFACEQVADVGEFLNIETITMNGFSIQDVDSTEWSPKDQRRFIVLSPKGLQHEVVVEIAEEVMTYLRRMTRRDLPASSSFWTSQARLLLSNYLWEKGEVPKMNFLKLSEIDRAAVLVAERWVTS